MHGFTRDPKSRMWYSPEKGGLWFDPESGQCYSVARGMWLPRARASVPANGGEPDAGERVPQPAKTRVRGHIWGGQRR